MQYLYYTKVFADLVGGMLNSPWAKDDSTFDMMDYD